MAHRGVLIALGVIAIGCTAAPRPWVLAPEPLGRADAAALVARAPLGPAENIRATELQRGAHSSTSLVQIRDRETPHVHTRYDLAVTLLSGQGTLWLAGTPLAMHPGDVAVIPRGTAHCFVNEGRRPAAALVVFSPPFTGPDHAAP